jgi:hypothetical protein
VHVRLRCGLDFLLAGEPAAIRANTEYAEEMLLDLEPMLRSHSVLYGLELGGVKLDDPTTFSANHMVMMLMFIVVFVMSSSVTETDFPREPRISQEL